MVGVAGFEPTTLCPPDKCATRLRYTPTARRHREGRVLRQAPISRVGENYRRFARPRPARLVSAGHCFWPPVISVE